MPVWLHSGRVWRNSIFFSKSNWYLGEAALKTFYSSGHVMNQFGDLWGFSEDQKQSLPEKSKNISISVIKVTKGVYYTCTDTICK